MSTSRKSPSAPITPTLPAIAPDIDWTTQHALVLGLGESGLACTRWLLRRGARVTVIDSRQAPSMQERLAAVGAQERVDVHTGVGAPFAERWLSEVDLVIPGPGLTPHAVHGGPAAALIQAARAADIPVFGEIDLFEWAIHHAAHASSQRNVEPDLELPLELPKVLAITGTNGKTTTTQMTTALLRRAGFDAQEAGNISPSLLDAVMAREDESRFPQVWVLELSSFQLAYAQHFHPTAAVCLNITEDHLDWHVDMADYIAAKMRVYGVGVDPLTSGVIRIIPREGWPRADGGGDAAPSRDRQESKPAKQSSHLQFMTFGLDVPTQPGDLGLIEEGLVWMAMRDLHDEERLHRLMPADALRVRGRHNALNALAALALCRAVTPALAPLLHALREFRGGAHRVEWIAHLHGIEFIDDSKGTNVGATVAALTGLTLPIVLIAGGEGKGQDFSPLTPALRTSARAVITIGKDGPAIARAAEAAGLPVQQADSMEGAVHQAFAMVQQLGLAHAAILLSPACASFDMYANYVARAQAFRHAVSELAAAQGVAC